MPFLYNMVVKESTIEGKGLYTQELIPKGKVLWVWGGSTGITVEGVNSKENCAYNKDELEKLPKEEI